MNRLKFYAATFAFVIGLLITFNQTARAQACVTNPVVTSNGVLRVNENKLLHGK